MGGDQIDLTTSVEGRGPLSSQDLGPRHNDVLLLIEQGFILNHIPHLMGELLRTYV